MEKKKKDKEPNNPFVSPISNLLPTEIIDEISSPKFKSDKMVTSCLKVNNANKDDNPIKSLKPPENNRFQSTKNLALVSQINNKNRQSQSIQPMEQNINFPQKINSMNKFQSGQLLRYSNIPQNFYNFSSDYPNKNFVPILPRRNVQSQTNLNFSSFPYDIQTQNNQINNPIYNYRNNLQINNQLRRQYNNPMMNSLNTQMNIQNFNPNYNPLSMQNNNMINRNNINNFLINSPQLSNQPLTMINKIPNSQPYIINSQYNNPQNINNELNEKELEAKLESLSNHKSFKSFIHASGDNLFIQLIKNCKGSVHFQKMLICSPPTKKEINILVQIFMPILFDLVCDCYANYFMQKFFPICSKSDRIVFLKAIKPNFYYISNNLYGNHCLQTLFLLQTSGEERKIIKEFISPKELPQLCLGANSCHVVEKIIKIIPENEREMINTFVIGNAYKLSFDPNGIYIIREFIKNIEDPINKSSLVLIFETQTLKLCSDQYGNFVIQDIINRLGENYCKRIISEIRKNILILSLDKFSSNVVDCLIKFYYENKMECFHEVVNFIFMKHCNLSQMLKNKYSTFVIENCLLLLLDKNRNKEDEKLFSLRTKIYNYLVSIPLLKEKKNVWKILTEAKI